MAKLSLSSRVKSYLKSSAKVGNVALDLVCATIEHAIGDSGDWTLLANLVAGEVPANAKVMKAIANKVGLSFKVDTAQPSGLKVSAPREKIRANNEAMAFLADLQVMAGQGKLLLGTDVHAALHGAPKADKPRAAFVDQVEKAALMRIKEGAKVQDMIAELQAAIARLEKTLPPVVVVADTSRRVPRDAIAQLAKARKPRAQMVAEQAH